MARDASSARESCPALVRTSASSQQPVSVGVRGVLEARLYGDRSALRRPSRGHHSAQRFKRSRLVSLTQPVITLAYVDVEKTQTLVEIFEM